MGTECVLQVEEHARVINEQSTLQISERDPGFKCCGLLDRVYGLSFLVDIPLLKKPLTGDFGGPVASLGSRHSGQDGWERGQGKVGCESYCYG